MTELFQQVNIIIIVVIFAFSLYVLSKSADILVDHAIKLSKVLGLSEIIIGATVVSLGTTLPEFSASVTSALQGYGGFAIGNAIGSIIVNTSLIVGIASLFGTIPLTKKVSGKLTILNMAVLFLVLPLAAVPKIYGVEGHIQQWTGGLLLILVPIYIGYSFLKEKEHPGPQKENSEDKKITAPVPVTILIIFGAAMLIALSASALVSSAEVLAARAGVPDVVIASTIIASAPVSLN